MAAAGDEALDELYWRAEILQAMYWMRGEGLADTVEPARLAEFLVGDERIVAQQLRQLAAAGYVQPSASDSRYALTEQGLTEGARSFHDDFAELTHPGHMECAPGCWCKDPDHAGDPCPTHPEEQPERQPARG